jgi:hypothetical protein
VFLGISSLELLLERVWGSLNMSHIADLKQSEV